MNKWLGLSLLMLSPVAAGDKNSAIDFYSASNQSVDIIGEAFSLKNDRLLYREYHQFNGNQHVVIYKDRDGSEFSRKTVDYSISQQAPSFTQHNQWSGETIAVDYHAGTISLNYRNSRDNTNTSEQLTSNKTLIIDAGFNRYIQNNWQALLDGKSTVFDFALADRQDLIALEIARSDCKKRLANKTSAADKVCFSIGANNRLIRWLIGSLDLVYSKDTKQLLRFTGLANINDQQGAGLKVDIHYYYPPADR